MTSLQGVLWPEIFLLLFYFLSMKELAPLKQHLTIVIGDEMSTENVELYEAFCVSSLFPPAKRYSVTALVANGCQKPKVKCEQAPSKRAGRPCKNDETSGHFANGSFLSCDPATGRISEPEHNEHVTHSLQEIWLYPKMDCLVYDRACSLKPMATNTPDLNQISFYIVDKFHSYGHAKTRSCNPRTSVPNT